MVKLLELIINSIVLRVCTVGIGFRIFLVKDDDPLERISFSLYGRLLHDDAEGCFARYAGKQIRHALLAVDLVRRKSGGILHTQYAFLRFDSEGKLDSKGREREARMAAALFPPLPDHEHPAQLIDARHCFARKRYANEYLWEPSPEIEAAIMEAIFGKNPL